MWRMENEKTTEKIVCLKPKLTQHQIEILQKGDLNEIKEEFHDRIRVNAKDDNGRSAVQYLCTNNPTLETLDFFNENLADFNSCFRINENELIAPIHLFVVKNQIELLRKLLTFVIDVNKQTTEFKETALHLAIKNEFFKAISLLIKHGALLSVTNQKRETPLLYCCKHKPNRHIVKYLLSKKSCVNYLDRDLRNALFYLVKNIPSTKLFDLFVERKSKINPLQNGRRKWYTLLHSCCSGSPTIRLVKKIVSYGHKPKWKDSKGNTSLHCLCMSKIKPKELPLIADYFLELGCEINDKNNKFETCFHCLCMNQLPLECYQFFKRKGADLQMIKQGQATPLHLICKHNPQLEIIEWFLENGCKKQAGLLTNDDNSLLHNYCSNAHAAIDVPILQFFLELGLDINQKNYFGETPLHLLLKNDPNLDISVIEFMISNGANLALVNNCRENAFQVLLNNKKFIFKEPTFHLFLKNGIDLNNVDIKAGSIFHRFISTPNPDINRIKNCLNYGANPSQRTPQKQNSLSLHLYYCQPFNVEIIKLLIQYSKDSSIFHNPDFNTLLHLTKVVLAELRRFKMLGIFQPKKNQIKNNQIFIPTKNLKKEWKKESRKYRKMKKKIKKKKK
ncbi:ankyrin repeat-containing protein [Anaeramoeba flamelloides]|uniref:Ankyrin repeat-containing protein n=1 Tax=Anaeramoeba flamelloides TaxID=1746091 RepID=A0AAV7YM82_9EUKA|nr:ankyrin repeat-containing protein [Anaeramoeba flamelloides]